MQSAEIELKFPVTDLLALQQKLEQADFRLETPRTFEQNTLYDTPERRLRDSGQILRVRKYGDKSVVTHKRHPEDEDLSLPYKVRVETESEVADGAALAEIFTRLGFAPVFRYEKFRTEYADEGDAGCLVIDETPIGIYAELEGPGRWIDRKLAQLGVRQEDCLRESYGKLFLAWKQRTGSPAENLTFEEIAPAMAG